MKSDRAATGDLGAKLRSNPRRAGQDMNPLNDELACRR